MNGSMLVDNDNHYQQCIHYPKCPNYALMKQLHRLGYCT